MNYQVFKIGDMLAYGRSGDYRGKIAEIHPTEQTCLIEKKDGTFETIPRKNMKLWVEKDPKWDLKDPLNAKVSIGYTDEEDPAFKHGGWPDMGFLNPDGSKTEKFDKSWSWGDLRNLLMNETEMDKCSYDWQGGIDVSIDWELTDISVSIDPESKEITELVLDYTDCPWEHRHIKIKFDNPEGKRINSMMQQCGYGSLMDLAVRWETTKKQE